MSKDELVKVKLEAKLEKYDPNPETGELELTGVVTSIDDGVETKKSDVAALKIQQKQINGEPLTKEEYEFLKVFMASQI